MTDTDTQMLAVLRAELTEAARNAIPKDPTNPAPHPWHVIDCVLDIALPRITELEAQVSASDLRLREAVEEAERSAPWPEWATSLLDAMREFTGERYDDEIDLPEELRNWFDGYRSELEATAIRKEGIPHVE